MASRSYELILLGATGYTGKLTAEFITSQLPTDLSWAVAGRSEKKLEAVIGELKQLNPDRKQPDIEICELKEEDLNALAKKTKLLVSTIGPYASYGEPAIKACATQGTHYLDCTGETPWVKAMIEKYHDVAKEKGAVLIPQCGLDSVCADITSYVLQSHIRTKLNASTLHVLLTLYSAKATASGGTAASALNIFSQYSLRELAASSKSYALSPVSPTNPSKLPTAGLFYRLLGLNYNQDLGGIQTTGPMAGVDRSQVHRSWGLYELLSRNTATPDLSYGSRFRFVEYMRTKSILRGFLMHFGLGLTGLLFAFPPSRLVLHWFLKKFVVPAQGEGPSKEVAKNHHIHYRGVATADTPNKDKVLGKFEFDGDAYVLTGLTLAAAASVMLRGDFEATDAKRFGGGVLTPALLGQQYVEELRKSGVRIEVGF